MVRIDLFTMKLTFGWVDPPVEQDSFFICIYVCYFDRVEFAAGDKEIRNFRMIERHYFQNKLLKSFDFNFPFVVPNSKNNTAEHIYEFPSLKEDEGQYMYISSVYMHILGVIGSPLPTTWTAQGLKELWFSIVSHRVAVKIFISFWFGK